MAKDFKSLRGQLLLDGGTLGGSFFHRTVVLICQHDPSGAFGLVLNRLSESTVGEALEADIPEALREQPLHLGGPVQPTALSYLHLNPVAEDSDVLPTLKLGNSIEGLIDAAGAFSTSASLKIFAGYSGWAPGQLEDEMSRNAWLTHPATIELVFEDTAELWKRILLSKGWQGKLLAEGPDDLSHN